MSDFYKKFLVEDPRRLSPSGRFVGLAAFGKHPGWDDHIEDLGLETDSLILAKKVLYVTGIGGQIDAGAWEKLEAAQQLPAFKHLFVWQRGGQFLIGRLWSSSDGKGRTRYPMVVCAHFAGVTLGWGLKQALPALADLETGCTQTTSADEVRRLLGRKRVALREAIQSTDGRGEYAPLTPEVLYRILRPAGDSKSEGFLRVLYQIQGQFGTFAPGTFNARGSPAAIRAQQIRVPAAGEGPEQALLFWTRFFVPHLDGSVPLLLTAPLEAGWLDATAGEPESHEFFCLRASPAAVPMVSEIPYKLDDVFRVKATTFLEGFQRGEKVATDLQPAPLPPLPAPPQSKGRWLKWFGAGALALVGVVAAVLLLRDEKPENVAKASAKPPADTAGTGTNVQTAAISPPGDATVRKPAGTELPKDAEAEAVRLADEKKKSEAMAAAAKLKAEAEAAVKEKERELAEATRLEAEKQARLQRERELQEQQRKAAEAAEAKKKADAEEQAKKQLVTAPSTDAAPLAGGSVAVHGQMTNSIGMMLVQLSSKLWVGKYEVTQSEYQRVMGKNPSRSTNDLRQPVERVTWNDAREFCRKLTEMERGKLPAGSAYSLPTEKQWKEFLGGQKFEDLPGGGMSGRSAPHVVGQSGVANKFGLFDVLGNVWEWCLDSATGEEKLLKGGAFNSANYDRTLLPDKAVSNCGFRCILAPP